VCFLTKYTKDIQIFILTLNYGSRK